MQLPDGMIPVSSARALLVSMEMSRNKTPEVLFQARTDRAARPGCGMLSLETGGEFVRV
jgi:hypothetical protein